MLINVESTYRDGTLGGLKHLRSHSLEESALSIYFGGDTANALKEAGWAPETGKAARALGHVSFTCGCGTRSLRLVASTATLAKPAITCSANVGVSFFFPPACSLRSQ